jgi:hypothetical protein
MEEDTLENKTNEPSLKDTLKDISSKLENLTEKKKIKKFKLPWSGKVSKAKVKKNWVTIIYIQENKEVKFLKAPIEEGVIEIEDKPYIATTDYMLTYRGKPLLIQPSWSVKPFDQQKHYDEVTKNDELNVGWRYLVNWFENTQIKQKRSMSIMWIIIGIIVLAGLGYYLYKGGYLT